jgi:hypothetical protein
MNIVHMAFEIALVCEGSLTVPAAEVLGPVGAIVFHPFMTTGKELVWYITPLEDAHVWLEISEEMFPAQNQFSNIPAFEDESETG